MLLIYSYMAGIVTDNDKLHGSNLRLKNRGIMNASVNRDKNSGKYNE